MNVLEHLLPPLPEGSTPEAQAVAQAIEKLWFSLPSLHQEALALIETDTDHDARRLYVAALMIECSMAEVVATIQNNYPAVNDTKT